FSAHFSVHLRPFISGLVLCLLSSFSLCSIDRAPSQISTLSLHDALPISGGSVATVTPCSCANAATVSRPAATPSASGTGSSWNSDRKSTRLNSSHGSISYAVFCLKKKKPGTHAAATSARADVLPRRGAPTLHT